MNSAALIRMAYEEDLPNISALEYATPEAPHWQESAYHGYLMPAPSALQRKALFVSVSDDVLQGFAAAVFVAGEAELESIAVARSARRSGCGSRLLTAVLAWARAQGASSLVLEVRAANAGAQAFYLARGFLREGLRPGYYTNPPDDAVLMGLNLLDAGESL